MLSKVPICAATSWAKGCICCCCIWTGTEPPNIQRRDMKRSKILHSSKCRFLNEFRCLFLSNQENPNQGQSNRLDTNGYNWDNGALLHVVVAVRGLLSQALKIPWNRHFQVTHATDRHLETSVLVIILQFSSCREAAVETAGNWLIAAETAAGSYCLAGAEFALAFGSSHGEPLISQTYQGPNHPSLQHSLMAKLLWLWERPLTALPGKLRYAIYDTIRSLLPMQSTSRLWYAISSQEPPRTASHPKRQRPHPKRDRATTHAMAREKSFLGNNYQ